MTAPDAAREARAALDELDRRGFLRLVGGVASAALLPTGCGGAPADYAPPPDLALEHLTPRTYAVLIAAAERIVGPGGGPLVRERRVDPGAAAEAFLASSPALAGTLRQALLVLEFGVPPLVAKWRPFTALDGPSRDAALDDLVASRLALKRTLFKGVKSISLLGFYGSPAGRARTGYPADLGAAEGVEAAMTYDLEIERPGATAPE